MLGVILGSLVQPQQMSRGMKLRGWEIERLHYIYSENKASTDQPRSYAKNEYSHDAARMAYEPRYDKIGFLHMRKQRRRSASR